eukprot:CAMPEP_0115880812 /NCGR_PEP_ID=MMETSP0287-20121206/28082_1 /TAXON_ID=412157 /ORGANISM="Chrysochromulina rotalis, Strain UIO044" /LENGTH=117 /DNA_ID=CAMNT_0003336671 /DNA_START=181 /DNA_END=534 /DNA_ORIENTATION=+
MTHFMIGALFGIRMPQGQPAISKDRESTRAPGLSIFNAPRKRALISGKRKRYTTVAGDKSTPKRSVLSTLTREGSGAAAFNVRSACAARAGSFSTHTTVAPSLAASAATVPSPQPSS